MHVGRHIAALGIAVTAVSSAAGCTLRGAASAEDRTGGEAVVTGVLDGDTVEVEIGTRTEHVRLIGIDTPETHHPTKPVECFGPEASQYTASLLPAGTAVRLERDIVPRDDYGRLLAYVFRTDDGLFVNRAVLRDGYGEELHIEPNIAYRTQLRTAVGEARDAGRGLWSHCAGV